MTDATKAGQRHRFSDAEIIKGLRREMKAYVLGQMSGADDFAAKFTDAMKALGFEDEDGDGEITPDEAAEQAEEAEDEDEGATKALDLAARCNLVCEAVREALEEVGAWDADEDDESLGEMAPNVRLIAKAHAPDCPVLVYDAFAVACLDGGDWKIPYTLDKSGTVELATPDAWERVEKEWKPVPGAAPITAMGDAVKMLPDGTLVAQAVRFGSPDEPDMSAYADFFTKSTDFWLKQWDRRPMLYHHAMDEGTKDAPVIGEWVKAWADDAGVWLQGQLDAAHKYHAAIKELARRGLLRVSTDSAPHLVRRARQPNGTHEVKTWPILAASLTVSPAEPRLIPAELKATLADLGLSIDDAGPEATPETDAQRRASAAADGSAARRLAMELDLLDMETS
jgi:hypothetical protein